MQRRSQPHADGAGLGRLAGRGMVGLVLAGCALVSIETVGHFGGATFNRIVYDYLYDGVILAAAALCLLRAAREKRDRSVWLLFGVAIAAWAVGDLYWTFAVDGLPAADQPYPSLADAGYLLFYPPAYLAIGVLVRSRVTRFASSLFLDGIIVTLMLAALVESVVLPAVLRASGGSSEAVATNLAYPVADSLLLALALAIIVFGGYRLSLDVTLIAAALLLFGIADSVYAYQVAVGSYVTGTVLDLGWLISPVLVGVAAWSAPRSRMVARDAIEGWLTIIVPTGLTLTALGVEIYDHFDHVGLLPITLASSVIALSLIRLVLSFAENQRLLRKSRTDANSDSLTGLANRRALLAHAEEMVGDVPLQPHVLAIYDLDGFKHYNDTFGHLAGDALLSRLAARLHSVVAERGAVYRLGGDEFCLLAPVSGADAFELVAQAGDALVEESARFAVRASFGAALIPDDAGDVTDALRLADRRMYAQKATRPTWLAGTRDALLAALHERDPDLGTHVDVVGRLALAVARQLGLESNEVENIRTTAVLHDIGKLGIPDAILNKVPPLTPEERDYVETHTLIGERILAAAPATAEIARYVRSTHERWDGSGYPDGLEGEQIPLPARIVFVCDAYQAMTSERPYQGRRTPEEALAELWANAGTQFDPQVVAVFATIASPVSESSAGSAGVRIGSQVSGATADMTG